MAGVAVQLLAVNAPTDKHVILDLTPPVARGRLVARQTTQCNGEYSFADVPAGTHRVRFVSPPAYRPTVPGARDSDADPDGQTEEFTFGAAAGGRALRFDAGLVGSFCHCPMPTSDGHHGLGVGVTVWGLCLCVWHGPSTVPRRGCAKTGVYHWSRPIGALPTAAFGESWGKLCGPCSRPM